MPVDSQFLALSAPALLYGAPAAAVEHRRQALPGLRRPIARLTIESASETRGVPISVAQRRLVRIEVYEAILYLRSIRPIC